MEKWLYDLIQYAFNKGVVAGMEAVHGQSTEYEDFDAVVKYCYSILEKQNVINGDDRK